MSQSTETKPNTDVQRAPAYEVIAVHHGELLSSRSHVFLNYSDYGQADAPFTIAYYFWVIRGEGRIIHVWELSGNGARHPRQTRSQILNAERSSNVVPSSQGHQDLVLGTFADGAASRIERTTR